MLGTMPHGPGPRRRQIRLPRPTWPAAAGLGQASWFFGNLYEAVVDIPQLLLDAQRQRRPGLTSPGSPLRYYAPVAPLTIVATTAALIDRWRSGSDKRMARH